MSCTTANHVGVMKIISHPQLCTINSAQGTNSSTHISKQRGLRGIVPPPHDRGELREAREGSRQFPPVTGKLTAFCFDAC